MCKYLARKVYPICNYFFSLIIRHLQRQERLPILTDKQPNHSHLFSIDTHSHLSRYSFHAMGNTFFRSSLVFISSSVKRASTPSSGSIV